MSNGRNVSNLCTKSTGFHKNRVILPKECKQSNLFGLDTLMYVNQRMSNVINANDTFFVTPFLITYLDSKPILHT